MRGILGALATLLLAACLADDRNPVGARLPEGHCAGDDWDPPRRISLHERFLQEYERVLSSGEERTGYDALLYLLGSHWHAHTSSGFGDYLDNYITNDLADEVADYEHVLRMIGAAATADLLRTAADAYRRDDWAALEAMPLDVDDEDVPSLAQCYLERHRAEL